MWTVVYLANNTDVKNSICALLDNNGIINRVHAISPTEEEVGICYDVLVPAAEVSAAHALILDEEL
ncbi:MAG: hypothetical protein KIG65_01805 [Eubacteriales bacterium]|nr:hypothetical protein [Eubacteriales bacterium]